MQTILQKTKYTKKNLSISLLATVMLLFCIVSVQAQNQSDANSDVIQFHQWWDFSGFVSCTEPEWISYTGQVHEILKMLPNGTSTMHWNVYGEGIDSNGDLWKFHEAWNTKFDTHITRTWTLQGQKGAKFKLRALFVLNGNGEIVQDQFDPICD